jgi:hypothetical protein
MIQQRLVVAIACEVGDKPILLGARWKALEKPSALGFALAIQNVDRDAAVEVLIHWRPIAHLLVG